MEAAVRLGSSFRDPSGYVFRSNGTIFRRVSSGYLDHFESVASSGLFRELVEAQLLLPWEDAGSPESFGFEGGAVIRPEQLRFVSYPYEWCFGQFREAALATLDILERSFASGFVLKDASAFNMQFVGGQAMLIDSLSFEPYVEREPWFAYRQFCQHFLAPLALMSYVDLRLPNLMRIHIDGIPLDLAAKLLPAKARLNAGLSAHLFLHARANQNRSQVGAGDSKVSRTGFAALIDSLRRTVQKLEPVQGASEWSNYYDETNYSEEGAERKKAIVAGLLQKLGGIQTCWDLGANNATYSRLAVDLGLETVAWDVDPAAVNQAYEVVKKESIDRLLPLVQDFGNPSGDLGWNLSERDSIVARGPADVALALALIHHLAIGNNVPLNSIADFLASICRWLIIEFVPIEDSQVQRMLVARRNIFGDYSQSAFEAAFSSRFVIEEKLPIESTLRTMYLLRRID
jgi:hypothetical protein